MTLVKARSMHAKDPHLVHQPAGMAATTPPREAGGKLLQHPVVLEQITLLASSLCPFTCSPQNLAHSKLSPGTPAGGDGSHHPRHEEAGGEPLQGLVVVLAVGVAVGAPGDACRPIPLRLHVLRLHLRKELLQKALRGQAWLKWCCSSASDKVAVKMPCLRVLLKMWGTSWRGPVRHAGTAQQGSEAKEASGYHLLNKRQRDLALLCAE